MNISSHNSPGSNEDRDARILLFLNDWRDLVLRLNQNLEKEQAAARAFLAKSPEHEADWGETFRPILEKKPIDPYGNLVQAVAKEQRQRELLAGGDVVSYFRAQYDATLTQLREWQTRANAAAAQNRDAELAHDVQVLQEELTRCETLVKQAMQSVALHLIVQALGQSEPDIEVMSQHFQAHLSRALFDGGKAMLVLQKARSDVARGQFRGMQLWWAEAALRQRIEHEKSKLEQKYAHLSQINLALMLVNTHLQQWNRTIYSYLLLGAVQFTRVENRLRTTFQRVRVLGREKLELRQENKGLIQGYEELSLEKDILEEQLAEKWQREPRYVDGIAHYTATYFAANRDPDRKYSSDMILIHIKDWNADPEENQGYLFKYGQIGGKGREVFYTTDEELRKLFFEYLRRPKNKRHLTTRGLARKRKSK